MIVHGSTYLRRFLDAISRGNLIETAVNELSPHAWQFRAVAFRGMSGALIAPEIARRLGKSLTMVRKNKKDCHSSYLVEGALGCDYIIVDDCIASGNTVREIQRDIRNEEIRLRRERGGYNPEIAGMKHGRCVGLWIAEEHDSPRGWIDRHYENSKHAGWFIDYPAAVTEPAPVNVTATQAMQKSVASLPGPADAAVAAVDCGFDSPSLVVGPRLPIIYKRPVTDT